MRMLLIATLAVSMVLVSGCNRSTGEENGAGANAGQSKASLDKRIERLKAAVAADRPPTNAEELKELGLTLYGWANRRAKAGDDLPWMLPLAVVSMTRPWYWDEEITDEQMERAWQQMSSYVKHLQLRDQDPDAMGHARLINPGPHPISSRQTLIVEYTVGSRPMEEGGRIILSRGTDAVIDDPSAPGYATAETSRTDVTLEPIRGDASYSSFPPRDNLVHFVVKDGSLQPGDTITIRLGDTSAGGPGLLMDSLSNDFIPIELYVRLEEDGSDYVLPRLGLKTEGIGVAGVHGFAPSVLDVGEQFDLTVRSEDLQANRATGPIPGYRIMLNGESFRELPAGDDALVKVEDIAFDEPGVYRFTIESMDGSITGDVNPILVERDPEKRVFWGETHGHSGMAEGRGTSDAFFAFGRDDANLDFLVHSEHDIWLDDAEWEELRVNTQEFMDEDEMITYLGYEWTTQQKYGGHHNVVFRTAADRERVPNQTHPTLALLYQGLREGNAPDDVLIIPHAHQAGDWRYNDPDMQTLVEIQSFHGVFEWFGHMYLRHGHHIGFVSASDDHSSHPGYGVRRGMRSGLAGVIAREKSTDAIFDSMKALRTYAVMGDRMIMRFDVNGAGMGQRAPLADTRQVKGRVISRSPLDTLVVQRNSEEIWRKDFRTTPGEIGNGREHIEVEFTTSSQPLYEQRDIPRGRRYWSGAVVVKGARLVDMEAPAFIDVDLQSAEIDSDDPNRVNFRTVTRGQTSGFELILEDAGPNTTITVEVDGSVERRGNAYTRLRRGPIDIPAFNPAFRLGDLSDGYVRKVQEVQGHKDVVAIRRVIAEAPMDYRFEFEDESPRDGDYYTLRVLQENDQLGWSSPVWVGGYPSQ